MKIAFFHELPTGGARRATNMFASLLKSIHTIDLFTTQVIGNDEKQNYSNTFMFPFRAKVWKGNDWKTRAYKDTAELYALAKLHKQIAQKIDEKRYDIVFTNASQFLETPFILRFLQTPSAFYCHDPHYRMIYEDILGIPEGLNILDNIYERTNRFVRKYLDRQNFAAATYIIANSLFAKDQIKKTYGRESTLCYLGVDHMFFTPDERIKKDIDVLYIGSKQPLDGYKIVHTALSKLNKNIKTVALFGEENWVNDEEIRSLYRRAKMIVCTAYNEPFGLVPIEAMSCGTPVIAINEGGYRETVKDGQTGFLIERNPVILANKISWLLSHPKDAKQFGVQARQVVVQSWTWQKSAKQLENILKSWQPNKF